jgi:luciferase family oxidoreductase group 1
VSTRRTTLSVLDLVPVRSDQSTGDALAATVSLARVADELGYRRYWLAEHHNMPAVASAATSVVIGYVAGGTSTIRVGAGGIMLPNHAPLVIAEQFGTLESLFPGRIDLGLGRAPGTDPATAYALRRTLASDPDAFPQDVLELMRYFAAEQSGTIQAVPGAGLRVPLYILGSSTFGARVAAALGLPFAFASHFAPRYMMEALEIYRATFRPSPQLAQPYAILGVNVVAAETDEDARFLATSGRQSFANLRRGMPTRLPPPNRAFEKEVVPFGAVTLEEVHSIAMVGSASTVLEGFRRFIALTAPDELMVVSHIFDHSARVRSYELTAQIGPQLAGGS